MSKQLERMQEEAEVTIAEVIDQDAAAAALNDLYFQLGGLDAIHAISANLNGALIKRFQHIRDTRTYVAAGYDRFDDFMDKFPRSPMSYKRFNYIENIFKDLGGDVFDLTLTAGLSARQQKLLGKGNVEIDGDLVRITIGDETIESPIENRRQVLQTLKLLADSNADKSKTLERQKEKIAKHDGEKRELYDEIDRVKAAARAEVNDDPHSHAIVNLSFAYQNLIASVDDMSEIEQQQFVSQDFELIAHYMNELATSYGRDDWTNIALRRAEPTGDDLDAILSKAMDEDESALAKAM
ncbi:MAG TPA: hypothetical protein VGO43_08770 [Pyrinomonadaceae bacterium]|jgi:hypothetical protein|nr:hypothetical protein [Pyrinomonadaceae bacterium]